MLSFLQRIGKSLMLPIAVLPAAALVLRLGQPDLLDIKFVAEAGNAIFAHLALIFAMGVAIGFSKDNHGSAALAGVIGYFVLTAGAQAINEDINMSVLGGIFSGIIAGLLYNKFYNIQLPEWLAFFGGKRFVPIVTSGVMLIFAFLFGFIWPPIQEAINSLGQWIINAGAVGVGMYGFFNRLLIPVGLHHVINTLIWFEFGSFTDAGGQVWHGDIPRFLHGDPTAGTFQAGFFPIMMFGLPAACFAIYLAAKKHRKKAIGGMMFGLALTSFLTGVTEPIEYSFMFLSPLLYVIHAILTGSSMVVAFILDIHHGFGFSAGAIDYVLNFGIAQNPLLLLVQGAIYAVIYFLVFYFVIKKFDLKTPGREEDDEIADDEDGLDDSSIKSSNAKAYHYLQALGGKENIKSIDNCATRLRLELNDTAKVNEAKLKRQGANGVVKMSKTNLQVIVGTKVEFLADDLKELLNSNETFTTESEQKPEQEAASQSLPPLSKEDFVTPVEGKVIDITEVPDEVFSKKMMGDGFAIEPSSGLISSPVDGKIVNVFPTKHAIGIETSQGYEILIHVGLETVNLNGEGFEVFVEQGDNVTKGQKLLEFHLDQVKEKVPSTVTPIIFTNIPEDKSLQLLKTGLVVKGDDGVIEVK